jgi:hypothetical protein
MKRRSRQRIRRVLLRAPWLALPLPAFAQPASDVAGKRWYDAAARMKRDAEANGDQPYGAVLVLDGRLVGEGPSA